MKKSSPKLLWLAVFILPFSALLLPKILSADPEHPLPRPDEAPFTAEERAAAIEQLTPLQYRVALEDGTERAFQNRYWDNKRSGIYVDILAGKPLFASVHKYRSGTGWPSFYQPINDEEMVLKEDRKFGMVRTEVRTKTSDIHLGHVFKDGPPPTGLRYCMNSAAMRFIPIDQMEAQGYEAYLKLFE